MFMRRIKTKLIIADHDVSRANMIGCCFCQRVYFSWVIDTSQMTVDCRISSNDFHHIVHLCGISNMCEKAYRDL